MKPTPLLKKCCKCKQELPYKNFGLCSSAIDLKQPFCISCSREYGKKWRSLHKKEIKERYKGYDKERYLRNKENMNERTKKNYEKNKEYWVEYRRKNKEKIAAATERWLSRTPNYHKERYLRIKDKLKQKRNERRK